MFLDKESLNKLLVSKYSIVVVGKLQDEDRKVIKHSLNLYSREKNHVGESHIDGYFFKDMSKGLRSLYSVDDNTCIMFFKNGFLEHKRQGGQVLFGNLKNLNNVIKGFLDIRLPKYETI